MVDEGIDNKYQGTRGAAALTDVRRHTRETDTRYTQRVAYFMEFNNINEAADRVEALASGDVGQSDLGGKTPEELYKSAIDLGNVLKDIANVLRSFPGYKAAIEKGNQKIVEMEDRLVGLERMQTSVLSGFEEYMKSGRDEIEKQTKTIQGEVSYLKDQMSYVRGEVRGNRTETFEYLGKIFTKMDSLTAETGQFMETISSLSRGMPEAVARRLNDLQQKFDQLLSSSNLTDVVENSLIRLSQKKISLIDAGWQTITSLTDVESLKRLKETAETIEKKMVSLDKVYGKLEEIRRDVGAAGRNSETATRSLIVEVDELGNNIVSDGKNTRHDAVRSVAMADIKNKGRFSEAYRRLDELRSRIDGLEGKMVASFEGALDSAIAKYKAMGLSEQEAGQIREVMVGGVMKALETHEGHFDKSFREFSESLDRKGVKMDPKDKDDILKVVRDRGVTEDDRRGIAVIVLKGLEERLQTIDFVTEKKAREVAGEEADKRVAAVIDNLDRKMPGYIDGAVGKAIDGLSKKINEASTKAPEKPKRSKPEGEPKSGEEKVTVIRGRKRVEETGQKKVPMKKDFEKLLDEALGGES